MPWTSWFRPSSPSTRKVRPPKGSAARRARPALEALEERVVPDGASSTLGPGTFVYGASDDGRYILYTTGNDNRDAAQPPRIVPLFVRVNDPNGAEGVDVRVDNPFDFEGNGIPNPFLNF